MEFYEEKTITDLVNTKGSRIWYKMNENSKERKHRHQFVAEHGGFFTKTDNGWIWTSPIKEKNGYWLRNIHTEEKVFFESMKEFGDQHGLTAVKICELLNGKRKTYKGWTAVELREVKEGPGSFDKIPEPKKKKIPILKTAIFVDTLTGELIHVNNLRQFSLANGFDYAAIKKLANGKAKSCKNLKLYNPLEKYKDSPETK